MSKLFLGVGMGCVLTGLVGCASVGSVANKMVNNKSEGVIYGFAGVDINVSASTLCQAINNRDYRCANSSEYVAVFVYSKVGFADGSVGINALVKKDFPNLEVLKHSMRTGNKNAPYVKARIVAGQLGEVLEIMPTGACSWSGMPSMGGTVCAGLYDYTKDYTGVIFR